jgi:hypothetical protein
MAQAFTTRSAASQAFSAAGSISGSLEEMSKLQAQFCASAPLIAAAARSSRGAKSLFVAEGALQKMGVKSWTGRDLGRSAFDLRSDQDL